MDSSKISVIIPAYNVGEYVEECLRSLIAQTYDNIEIIVVDDGSTDGTYAVCDRIRQEDGRIRLFRKQNGGISSARNLGLKNASGDYFMFADSDDVTHPQLCELLMKALTDNGADISACDNIRFRDGSDISDRMSRRFDTYSVSHITSKAGSYNAIIKPFDNSGGFNWVWNKLYSGKVLNGRSFDESLANEDTTFNMDAFENCEKCVWISQKLYFYRQREGSACNSGFHAHFAEAFPTQIRKLKKLDFLPGEFMDRWTSQALINCSVAETKAWIKKEKDWQKRISKAFDTIYDEGFHLVKNKKSRLKINFFKHCRPLYHASKYFKLKK